MAFSLAGERIGSLPVNVLRFGLALPMTMAVLAFRTGSPLPFSAPTGAWAHLSLSGFVGYFLGDLCLFRAFVEIGPRRSLLVMSLAPPMAAALAAAWLGERLEWQQWAAMGVTLAGVALVVAERTPASLARRPTLRGYWLAFGGAVGQAAGMVLAKRGMAGLDSAWAASAIRILSGTICFAVLAAIRGEGGRLSAALANRAAVGLVALGALAGPFAGVTLMLYALARIPAGLAQTFAATTPVLIIPLSRLIHREHISRRAVAGALIAFAGVALLFYRP